MKRHIIILLLMGLMPIHLLARTISREEAANFALQFLSDGESEPELAPMLLNTDEEDLFAEEGHEYMYLVQTIDDGWVVMSTDDRFPPVLAKGDGIFYPFHDSIPPAMRELLNDYIREMKYIEDSIDYAGTHVEWNLVGSTNEEAKAAYYENGNGSSQYTPGTSLLDLVTGTKNTWQQDACSSRGMMRCYNIFCPYDFSNPSEQSLVGCGAVAMAQVMWYWRWPHTAFIPTEIDENGNTNDITDVQIYAWKDMPAQLLMTTNAKLIENVAKLMRDCGYAAKMKYSSSGSKTSFYKVKNGLINNFAYKDNMDIKYSFITPNWSKRLRNEINAKRPIIYGATEGIFDSTGHMFVIDGYHETNPNMFHINWGDKDGVYNDFFYLNRLTEDDGTLGNYNYHHHALIKIQPDPTCTPQVVSSDVSTGEISCMATGDIITISSNIIEPNSRAVYTSGTGIRITPGFQAKFCSNVTLQIRSFPCDYVANATVQAVPREPEKDVIEQKIEHNDQFSWSASPNPVTSHLRVNTDKDIRTIELYSIDGRRYEWIEQKEINVSSLPNGMYLLRVHCMDNKILQTKIIKQ